MRRTSPGMAGGLILLAFLFGRCTIAVASGLTGLWSRAVQQTMLEQSVEDVNSLHRVEDHLVRRLICLPLSESFASSAISVMQGKVQHGDKCSLPASIGRIIFGKPYEVPWLFEVTPVKTAETSEAAAVPTEASNTTSLSAKRLRKVYVSPLDFRSPENYIFMPSWAMESLGLRPFDLVDVSFVRIKLAALVVLQPLNLEWDSLLEQGKDPKSILEHEINKYSSLTAGSTISIEYGGTTYSFFVQRTHAEGGVAVHGVRIQDSDVKVDIDRSVLDAMLKQREEEEQRAKIDAAKKKGRSADIQVKAEE